MSALRLSVRRPAGHRGRYLITYNGADVKAHNMREGSILTGMWCMFTLPASPTNTTASQRAFCRHTVVTSRGRFNAVGLHTLQRPALALKAPTADSIPVAGTTSFGAASVLASSRRDAVPDCARGGGVASNRAATPLTLVITTVGGFLQRNSPARHSSEGKRHNGVRPEPVDGDEKVRHPE